jgi:hypothetical protein
VGVEEEETAVACPGRITPRTGSFLDPSGEPEAG